MLCVDHARWGQTPEDLRRLALSAPHPRTRERFLALYDITQQSRGATRVAAHTGRHPQTVIGWLHAYNAHGPDALLYRRTGGRPPFAAASRPASARSLVKRSAPPPPRP
jgi:transposase